MRTRSDRRVAIRAPETIEKLSNSIMRNLTVRGALLRRGGSGLFCRDGWILDYASAARLSDAMVVLARKFSMSNYVANWWGVCVSVRAFVLVVSKKGAALLVHRRPPEHNVPISDARVISEPIHPGGPVSCPADSSFGCLKGASG